MKVVHIIKTLCAGGAELHLLTLCGQLKRNGAEVVVAHLVNDPAWGAPSLHGAFEGEGIRVVNLNGRNPFNMGLLERLGRLLREERPDIVHTHLPRTDAVGAISRFRTPSIPWVCSVHDIYSKSWSGKCTLPLLRAVWRRADAVVAISHAVKHWLVDEMGVPAERVTVIHYGIDSERFVYRSSGRAWNSAMNGGATIGSIGRLEERKGHECLIRAMPAVLRQIPNASLLIAGSDPFGYSRTIQGLIERLNLTGQVRVVGFQSDVFSFLHSLDVFALASRSEGFGQVIVEAMAAGKPVVTSRISPLTEIVVDGQTGLLAEPENPEAFAAAISWLLTHSEEARRMGREGQERVRSNFDAERMAAETLRLYRTLVA